MRAVRDAAKRLVNARYERGPLLRTAIYCLLAPRFARLAEGRRAKARIVAATLTTAVAEALPRKTNPLRIPVDYGGRRHQLYVGGCNDLDVLKAVLLDDAYDEIDLPRPPSVIVDLGSHIGASLLVFRARHPHARLIGVEPDPATFERLRLNSAALGEVTISNAAVAGTDGTVSFYPWRDSWGSSMFRSGRAGAGIEVRACKLGTLLDEVGVAEVGLLKMNIEGAELAVIESFDEWDRVGALIVEWHGEYLAPSSLASASEMLRRHFHLTVEPVPSRPGDYVISGVRRARPAG